MNVLLWIGFSQSLFAALLIATKKNNSISDRVLTTWLFLLAVSFLSSLLSIRLFGFPLLNNTFLLFNPAFYLYIRSLIEKDFKARWIQAFHLIPFIAFETTVLTMRIPLTFDSLLGGFEERMFGIFFVLTSLVSWLIYLTTSILLVNRFRRNLENEYSTIATEKSLGWVLFILIFYVVFCVFIVILGIYSFFAQSEMAMLYAVNFSVLLLLVYILAFYGLRQGRVYFENEQIKVSEKYRYSPLSAVKKKEIKNKLIDLFSTMKPYLDAEFNMNKLSQMLNIPKHHLTEVLNTEIGMNFFMFVNNYRVGAVKEKLDDPLNPYSIEAIGYECGFSAKSSFFTTFKKLTGLTPLEYKQTVSGNT